MAHPIDRPVDPAFLALPLRAAADAALQAARDLGVEHADVRVERLREQDLVIRDGRLQNLSDDVGVGIAVRVVHDGTWGFASSPDVTPDEAAKLAREAVAVAKVARPLNRERVELADEPVHADATWVSAYDVDPFGVPAGRRRSRCSRSGRRRLLAHDEVDHVDVHLQQALENKFYADLAGTIDDPAAGAAAAPGTGTQGRPGRRLRDDAHHRPARGPRLGVPHLRLGLGRRAGRRCPSGWWRRPRPAASSQAATTWSSTPPTSG